MRSTPLFWRRENASGCKNAGGEPGNSRSSRRQSTLAGLGQRDGYALNAFPDAAHSAIFSRKRCNMKCCVADPGSSQNSASVTIPGLHRTTTCCAAPGKSQRPGWWPCSNISPGLHASGDGEDPREEYAEDRDDDGYSDLVRLQPLALPDQERGKGKAPNGGNFRIELAAQGRAHAVVPEHVPY